MKVKADKKVTVELTVSLSLEEATHLWDYLNTQPKKLKCSFKQLGQEEEDSLEEALLTVKE